MQKLQAYVVVKGRRIQVGLTRNPLHLQKDEAHDWKRTRIITPPLPSYQAYLARREWERRLEGPLAPVWLGLLSLKQFSYGESVSSAKGTGGEILDAILQLVRGYLITEEWLFRTLRAQGYWPADLSRALDLGIKSGVLQQLPGVSWANWGRLFCSRCQSEDIIRQPCVNCGLHDCPLCRSCAPLGANRGCTTLITAVEGKPEGKPIFTPLTLAYELTSVQQKAADELVKFWESSKKRALIWAACGAGKTEVSFPLMQRALSQGERVLFAIPRSDIVREVGVRIGEVFPKTTVAVHYGGQPLFAPGNLVVATTHQVLRFYRRFGLVILDEVDAFPYRGNEMLRYGLKRALAPQGKLVEMTATPRSLRKQDKLITIPVRFHGHPLPEPKLQLSLLPPWDELSLERFPSPIMALLNETQHPWLVFAPTIDACKSIYKILKGQISKRIGICHSKDPQRLHTIRYLRKGALDVVVTTSVLERGVNFPRIGVLVLYAEHAIFTEDTLVQIAGRVGRSAQSPQGTVLFLGRQITSAMRGAVRLIRKLNQKAARKGLLTHDPV